MRLSVVSYLPVEYDGQEATERPAIKLARLGHKFVALLPLDRWRAQGLTQRVTRWFDANSKHRLFPPDSADDDRCDEGGEEHRRGTCRQPSPHQRPSATQVASGLGLPYLIFKGSVGCWADDTVLDGLGYVDTTDLHKSGVSAKDMSGCPRPCIPRSPGAP